MNNNPILRIITCKNTLILHTTKWIKCLPHSSHQENTLQVFLPLHEHTPPYPASECPVEMPGRRDAAVSCQQWQCFSFPCFASDLCRTAANKLESKYLPEDWWHQHSTAVRLLSSRQRCNLMNERWGQRNSLAAGSSTCSWNGERRENSGPV